MTAKAIQIEIVAEGQVGEPARERYAVPQQPRDLLTAVWDDTAPRLIRLARASGLDAWRAEDVLQDVYLTALEKAPATDRQDVFRRWLFTVTVNRCRLEHRRRARWATLRSAVAAWWPRNDNRTAVARATMDEQRDLVRHALDSLDEDGRLMLVLRYYGHFDSKEIGKIFQLPSSTVRSRLRAARRRLAAALRDLGYIDE